MISYNKISHNDTKSGVKVLSKPIIILNLFSAHNFSWTGKFYFSGESHKYHEAVYVLDGEVSVSEDDRIYHLQKGSLIVHAPYEFHRISTDSGARVLIFSFESDELFPSGLYDGFFALPIEEEREFCALFDKIYTFYHESGEEDFKSDVSLEIACALPAFFLSLIATHKPHQSSVRSRSEEEYRKLVETMMNSVCENLSLEDIAAKNHTSVSYVKHLFHRYAGVGAKSYYSSLRLREIIKLLEKDVPVAEVARQLNFSSPEYLSLFFKKHMGVPPGRWRNGDKI